MSAIIVTQGLLEDDSSHLVDVQGDLFAFWYYRCYDPECSIQNERSKVTTSYSEQGKKQSRKNMNRGINYLF